VTISNFATLFSILTTRSASHSEALLSASAWPDWSLCCARWLPFYAFWPEEERNPCPILEVPSIVGLTLTPHTAIVVENCVEW